MFNAILNALVSGATQTGAAPQANTPSQPEGDLLTGILGSLMGGQADATGIQNQVPQQSQPTSQGDMMTDLLGAFLGGGQTGGSAPAVSQPQADLQGDLMSGLLGSLLGGQTGSTGQSTGYQAAQQAQPASQGDLMSGLLGSLLGGQAPAAPQQSNTNPLLGLVTSGQNPMLNSLIKPVVDKIAVKLGIPPAIAMTVVTFAIQYMLSSQGKQVARGEDLSGVIQQYSDQKYLRTAGLSKELAQQTGLKPKVAASALSEAFLLLGADSPSNL